MTVFQAEPAAICAFAQCLSSLAVVASPSATGYTRSWVTPVGDSTGLVDDMFSLFYPAADDVSKTVTDRLTKTSKLLSAAATLLDQLAELYLQTDAEKANDFGAFSSKAAEDDAGYTDYDTSPIIDSVPHIVDDINDPSGNLTDPPGGDAYPDLIDTAMSGGAIFFSPSGLVLTILGWCGVSNPLDSVTKFFAGDWNTAVKGSQALTQLAAFHESMADSVVRSKNIVMQPENWSGNSADAANSYFSTLVSAIDDLVPRLVTVSGSFMQVAADMQHEANAVEGIIEAIADKIIASLAVAALTGIFSWTGVGDIIGALSEAGLIADIIYDFYRFTDELNKVMITVSAFVSTANEFVNEFVAICSMSEVESLPGGYTNPLVPG